MIPDIHTADKNNQHRAKKQTFFLSKAPLIGNSPQNQPLALHFIVKQPHSPRIHIAIAHKITALPDRISNADSESEKRYTNQIKGRYFYISYCGEKRHTIAVTKMQNLIYAVVQA